MPPATSATDSPTVDSWEVEADDALLTPEDALDGDDDDDVEGEGEGDGEQQVLVI